MFCLIHLWLILKVALMFARVKSSPVPIWVNVVVIVLILFMLTEVYLHYFDHEALIDAGVTIEGDADKNVVFTTAARLLAMIAISVVALWTQNPSHFVLVMLMSVLREGQETFIDPSFPCADSPWSPTTVAVVQGIIVLIEIAALVAVYRIDQQQTNNGGMN